MFGINRLPAVEHSRRSSFAEKFRQLCLVRDSASGNASSAVRSSSDSPRSSRVVTLLKVVSNSRNVRARPSWSHSSGRLGVSKAEPIVFVPRLIACRP